MYIFKKKSHAWLWVAGFVMFLYVSSVYGRIVYNYIRHYDAIIMVLRFFVPICGGGSVVLLYGWFRKRSVFDVFLFLFGLGAALYAERFAYYPVEKVHFVEYGALGFLMCRAVGLSCRKTWLIAIGAFCLTTVVGVSDEIIQLYVPERVFDVRDIILNAVGAGLGVYFYLLHRQRIDVKIKA